MARVWDVDYLLTHFQDGDNELPFYHYREIRGKGKVDQFAGTFDMDLNIQFGYSQTWDPAIIILICCDNLRFFSANADNRADVEQLRGELHQLEYGGCVNRQREGIITTEEGEIVASVKAKGSLILDSGTAYSRTSIYKYDSKLYKYGGIETIELPYTETVVPTVPGRATGISRYSLICKDGTRLVGTTDYPYVFNAHGGAQNISPWELKVEDASFKIDLTNRRQPTASYHVGVKAF